MVLLDLEGESYFGLNEVGARIWQLLQERLDPDALMFALEQEYEVERGELESDVGHLLDQLLEARLVQAAQEEG